MYNAPGSSAPFILSVPCLLRSMALAYGELKPNLRMYWFGSFTEGSVSGTSFSLLLSCGVFLCGHKKFESVTAFLKFFNRVQSVGLLVLSCFHFLSCKVMAKIKTLDTETDSQDKSKLKPKYPPNQNPKKELRRLNNSDYNRRRLQSDCNR
ncbi:hypothetical protein F2Q69_00015464 [Brassica cretica]|uniref:Uncharacterized protein n=1 Tax=Brassica cretica TaxID=69181 RepID=A0A8S9QZS9_BRACR|nr:hypothetical protein F2Q69_00015464 [Brassica cretica]